MICIVDTSILCEILQVPNMSDEHLEHLEALKEKVAEGERLLVPMPAVFETGNHIGQNGSGRQRRDAAKRFVSLIKAAIAGEAPFTPTPFPDVEEMRDWLSQFPTWTQRSDHRGKGSGLADLSIQLEWQRQRRLNPMRRVYIWSKDVHLSSYDTGERR